VENGREKNEAKNSGDGHHVQALFDMNRRAKGEGVAFAEQASGLLAGLTGIFPGADRSGRSREDASFTYPEERVTAILAPQ